MDFTPIELLRYGGAIVLEAGVFGLALRRGLYRRFRLFPVYFGALVVFEIARWVPILRWGLASKQAFWTYWVTQIVLVVLRGAVVFEICHYVLGPYRGIWRLCRVILVFVAGLVVISALFTSEQRGPFGVRIGLAAERGLELAILGVLLFALAFCRYYRIPVDRLSGLLALGIGLFAAIQVINNTFVNHWLAAYHPIWRESRFVFGPVGYLDSGAVETFAGAGTGSCHAGSCCLCEDDASGEYPPARAECPPGRDHEVSLTVIVFTLASLLLLGAIGGLLVKPLPKETSLDLGNQIEELLPLHSQHFPQLRQALESTDLQYVRRKTSRETERTWREERRRILRSFLDGLAEDFARLDRLSRVVASLSPRFSRREELERVWLSMRFRFGYRIISMKISVGNLASAHQLRRMTELIGNLSALAEAAMARLEVTPPDRGNWSH